MLQPDGTRAVLAPPPLPEAALAEAARLWQSVAANEESRFDNLNNRALGVLSTAGLVTSVGGFFAGDLLTGATLAGWVRGTSAALLAAALVLLAASAVCVVYGVLWPRSRPLFGDNQLTEDPATITDAAAVHRIAVSEFAAIAVALQHRNRQKATWLERSYVVVLLAVLTVSTAGVLVALQALLHA